MRVRMVFLSTLDTKYASGVLLLSFDILEYFLWWHGHNLTQFKTESQTVWVMSMIHTRTDIHIIYTDWNLNNGIQDLLLNIFLLLEISFKLSYFIEYIILKQCKAHTHTHHTKHIHEKYIQLHQLFKWTRHISLPVSNGSKTFSYCYHQTHVLHRIYDTEHGSMVQGTMNIEHWTWIFRSYSF